MSTVNNGATLYTFVTITETEATFGCTRNIKLPDMAKAIQIKIPAGTKHGAKIRFNGVTCNGQVKKSLLVTVNVKSESSARTATATGTTAKAAKPAKAKKKSTKYIFIALAVFIVFGIVGSTADSKPENTTVKTQTVSSKTYNSSSSTTNNNTTNNSTTNNNITNNTSNYTDNSSNDSFYAEYNLGGDVYTFYSEDEYQQFLTWIEEENNVNVDVDVNNTTNTGKTVSESDYPSVLTSCRWVSADEGCNNLGILWFEFYSDGCVAYSEENGERSYTDKYSLEGNRLRLTGGCIDDTYTISMTETTLTLTNSEGSKVYYSLNVLPSSRPEECPESVATGIINDFYVNSDVSIESVEYLGMYDDDYGHAFAKYNITESEYVGTYSGQDVYWVRTWEITCLYIPAAGKWAYWNMERRGYHSEVRN